ncbi:hypothetical protein HK414_14260 [Ramlibacter terrae]|uniref:Uncharacterized protein n=1 Tax=Ramlibacter terrae TaxID=2732511 RepID=A0ABX6P419_9BURK|nr:hypothetical protein HK414_14260 [Ramlibacter terrae]
MNEMSGLHQAPARMPAGLMPLMCDEPPPVTTDVQPHEVRFRSLRGHEINQILHLRNQIALPASAVNDTGFAMREKKETKSASSARSNATVSTSVPSATSP